MGKAESDNSAPVFSVVIPVYCCEKYIEETVRSALNQTFSDIEIIIVYDQSPDATEKIINELQASDNRVKVIKNKSRLGVAESRNAGILEARGEFIAFLDADDVWLHYKLQWQYNTIKKTGIDICYSSYSFIDKDSRDVGCPFVVKDSISFKHFLYGNVMQTSTCVVRSGLAKDYRMNKDFYHEDYVFWLEILRDGYKACGISEVLAKYRYTVSSRSGNKFLTTIHRWKVYREFLKYGVLKSFWYTSIGAFKAFLK